MVDTDRNLIVGIRELQPHCEAIEMAIFVPQPELADFITNPDSRINVAGRELAPNIGTVVFGKSHRLSGPHVTVDAEVLDRPDEVASISITFPGIFSRAIKGSAAKGTASVTIGSLPRRRTSK